MPEEAVRVARESETESATLSDTSSETDTNAYDFADGLEIDFE